MNQDTVTDQTPDLQAIIERIRGVLPPQNPWSSFVHVNPLVGYEDYPFFEGVARASRDYRAGAEALAASLRLAPLWAERGADDVAERQRAHWAHWLSLYFDQGGCEVTPLEKASGLRAFLRGLLGDACFPEAAIANFVGRIGGELGAEPGLLAELGASRCPAPLWEAYLRELAFDLKGWCGLVARLEAEPALLDLPAQASLAELLYLRLALENAYDETLARELGVDLDSLRREVTRVSVPSALPPEAVAQQLAEERAVHGSVLASLRPEGPDALPPAAAFVLTCMDDREESTRRHLEAQDSSLRTFGVLGNFGLDLRFRSLDEPAAFPRCPPVVVPRFEAVERNPNSRALGSRLALKMHFASRRPLGGTVTSWLAWPLLAWDLLRTFALPSRVAERVGTRVRVPFASSDPSSEIRAEGELAEIERDPARSAALIADFLDFSSVDRQLPPLVVLMAHTSSSRNNPFRLAYGCGACSGRSGDANARILARMANRDEVQAELRRLGFELREGTRFVAALHDTCSDELTSYEKDVDFSPVRRAQWLGVRAAIERGLEANAVERARGFESHRGSSASAHVRLRARDPGQVRPEYGHAGVAFAFFARRRLTRGLDLRRRAFLISYDARRDAQGDTLKRMLEAALPVCANIQLDYHFSRIDGERFGAGSKAPLNVAALSGVMMGTKGDLRTGLPTQMVEMHQPVRLRVLVEASEACLREALGTASPRVRNLIRNEWVLLSRIDPESQRVEEFGGRS